MAGMCRCEPMLCSSMKLKTTSHVTRNQDIGQVNLFWQFQSLGRCGEPPQVQTLRTCLPEGAHHVNSGCDGRVEQESLVRGEAGVRDSPAQIPRMHILAQTPIILCLVYPDAPVMLVRRCTEGCPVTCDRT